LAAANAALGSSRDVGVVVDGGFGMISLAMMSFKCGRAEVAIAIRLGSVGHSERLVGVNVVQDMACGARFCVPKSVGFGAVGA
jgi:hypothetical protein